MVSKVPPSVRAGSGFAAPLAVFHLTFAELELTTEERHMTIFRPPFVDVIEEGGRWGTVLWRVEFEPAEPNTEEAAITIAAGHERDPN